MDLDLNVITDMYYNKMQSLTEIADIYGTYPNKIARFLKKYGFILRDKSEAQKNALDKGVSKHPTEGRKRSKKEKDNISEGLHNSWKNMSKEDKAERKKKCQENWENLGQEKRDEILRKANEAFRLTATDGSKMEKFLEKNLQAAGFRAILHQKGLVTNTELEVDIYLPEIKTIIEVDGPSHFIAIWDEERLAKTIKADKEKSGLFLAAGYCIIRIKHTRKNDSQYLYRSTMKKVIKVVNEIKTKFPPVGKRYFELEAL